MYLLDTNVVSELRKAGKGRADPHVVRWAASRSEATMYLSAVTLMELELGILLLLRRDPEQAAVLRRWMSERVVPGFSGRILPVDEAVAFRCAALHVPATRAERDALIAATALEHGLQVITRNVRDFAGMGVAIVDPWDSR